MIYWKVAWGENCSIVHSYVWILQDEHRVWAHALFVMFHAIQAYQLQMYAKILFLYIGFSPTWFLKLSGQAWQTEDKFLISYINIPFSVLCQIPRWVEGTIHVAWTDVLTSMILRRIKGIGTYCIRRILKMTPCHVQRTHDPRAVEK